MSLKAAFGWLGSGAGMGTGLGGTSSIFGGAGMGAGAGRLGAGAGESGELSDVCAMTNPSRGSNNVSEASASRTGAAAIREVVIAPANDNAKGRTARIVQVNFKSTSGLSSVSRDRNVPRIPAYHKGRKPKLPWIFDQAASGPASKLLDGIEGCRARMAIDRPRVKSLLLKAPLQVLPEVRAPKFGMAGQRLYRYLVFRLQRPRDQPGGFRAVALQAEHARIVGCAQIVKAERIALVGRGAIMLERCFGIAWLAAEPVLIEIAKRRFSARISFGRRGLIGIGGLHHVDGRAAKTAGVTVALDKKSTGKGIGSEFAGIEAGSGMVHTGELSRIEGERKIVERGFVALGGSLAVPVIGSGCIRLHDRAQLEIRVEQRSIEKFGDHLAAARVALQRVHRDFA